MASLLAIIYGNLEVLHFLPKAMAILVLDRVAYAIFNLNE